MKALFYFLIAQTYKPLRVSILDEDTLAKDDVLGYTDVEWKECYEKPGSWVNRLFALKNEKKDGKDSGDVYIQVSFVPAEGKDDNRPAPTLPELVAEYGRVSGKVEVEVISAAKLKDMDAFGGKIDPFAVVFLSNSGEI